ncbi:RICIN domain-containing protein [Streptomyces sp. ARC32]
MDGQRTADHRWTLHDQGDGTCTIRNAHSGKLLAVQNDSPGVGAFVVQDADDGTADNRWRVVR